jgi:NAD+ synthase
MNTGQKLLNIDLESVKTTITRFITGKLNQAGAGGYVLGLSGGVDSSLAACLAVDAIGKEKVLGVMLPYQNSSKESRTDAEILIGQLGIEHRLVDISPMVDIYFEKYGEFEKIRAGNKMARERMAVLFDIAQETGRLVMGTGNRTDSVIQPGMEILPVR